MRKRLRKAFEKEIDIGETTHIYNPLEAARFPLWKSKRRLSQEWPRDPAFSFLLHFLYPLHADYARVSKSDKAIKIERNLNDLSSAILVWAFVLMITGIVVLVNL